MKVSIDRLARSFGQSPGNTSTQENDVQRFSKPHAKAKFTTPRPPSSSLASAQRGTNLGT